MTGSSCGGAVELEASIDVSANPTADDSQERQLIQDSAPANPFALRASNSGRCLDVPNGQTELGLRLCRYGSGTAANQNQQITAIDAGELRVLGNCLARPVTAR